MYCRWQVLGRSSNHLFASYPLCDVTVLPHHISIPWFMYLVATLYFRDAIWKSTWYDSCIINLLNKLTSGKCPHSIRCYLIHIIITVALLECHLDFCNQLIVKSRHLTLPRSVESVSMVCSFAFYFIQIRRSSEC